MRPSRHKPPRRQPGRRSGPTSSIATVLPDRSRWDYEVGFIRNNERQYYTRDRAENARVENGLLVIEARRERFEGADYTSASLTSRANWTYGRIEVRARLPKGRGTWPAVWTLGANIGQAGWPACGEIDIMEHVGFDPGRVHANIHTTAYNHVKQTNEGNNILVPGADGAFHVYAATWTPDGIAMSVDGQRYFTFSKEPGGDSVWPFDKPHYLILNLAIGGNWGGQRGIDDAAFPARILRSTTSGSIGSDVLRQADTPLGPSWAVAPD